MPKNNFLVSLLIAVTLTAIAQSALAKEEPPLEERSGELVLPKPSELESEAKPKSDATAIGSRGQSLYEDHCQACHTSIVHVRETRKARTMKDLEHWVTHWSDELNLPWGADEVRDVVDYLNIRYYKIEGSTTQPQ
jgi:mono/diheme cytochrome c family protein